MEWMYTVAAVTALIIWDILRMRLTIYWTAKQVKKDRQKEKASEL